MKTVLLILMFALLIICMLFQIRDIYIIKKYHKTDNSNFDCGFLEKTVNNKGHTISECKHLYCQKDFEDNNKSCPQKCKGRVFPDTPQNIEIMLSVDSLYCAKRIVYLLGTFFGTTLTILNIIDKI